MTMNYVFLHGGGQGSWVWQETIAALELHTQGRLVRTLALDVPGCGTKRDRATDDLTLRDVAQELISDIENARMADVVLIGHSQAGQAMAFMAEMRPDLFRRFIHISTSIPLPGQTVSQMMSNGPRGSNENEVGWPIGMESGDSTARYAQLFCNDMDDKMAAAFLAKLGSDAWPRQTYAFADWRYDALDTVPSTYVVCLRDSILPAQWQEIFAERFRAGRNIHIDAGHQAMTTRPHALAEIITQEAANPGA